MCKFHISARAICEPQHQQGSISVALANGLDSTPEEFESHPLNREKLIAGQGKATLAPSRYAFFGEFHENTARGVIVAE
jgi:hypothetical protein